MSCKFCGNHDLILVYSMQDHQCLSCGAFQRMSYEKVNHNGHRWWDITSMNGRKRRLVRVSWQSEMKKYGSVTVAIDYPKGGLVK